MMHGWANAENLDTLTAVLAHRLPPKRYFHTLAVAHTALALAHRWGVNPDAALAAALLHDIAKKKDLEPYRDVLMRDPEDRDFPGIWHAVAGAIIAREEFGVADPAVLHAIRTHPTGDVEMSDLDRIVFLADYTAPLRRYDGVEEIRRLARCDLAGAARLAIVRKTRYIRESGKPMHARSLRAIEAAAAQMGNTQEEEKCPSE